jgi:hypothetical protein
MNFFLADSETFLIFAALANPLNPVMGRFCKRKNQRVDSSALFFVSKLFSIFAIEVASEGKLNDRFFVMILDGGKPIKKHRSPSLPFRALRRGFVFLWHQK